MLQETFLDTMSMEIKMWLMINWQTSVLNNTLEKWPFKDYTEKIVIQEEKKELWMKPNLESLWIMR